MRFMTKTAVIWTLLTSCTLHAQQVQLRDIIDTSITEAQGAAKGKSAALADDYVFARRVFLDLTGRIPTAADLARFVTSEQTGKREILVDRLLNSPEYARHMQYTFDVMFMERLPKKHIAPADFQTYLRQAFAANKPYDQLASEILSADGAVAELRAASRFLLDREIKREETVRAIGRVFLGRDLQCAQCHNHPNVDDYLQQHYYGVAAFLQRSYLFTDPSTKVVSIGDKTEGDVKFTSVFTGEEDVTQPRILSLPEIQDPEQDAEPYEVEPDSKNRGIPKYARRLQLAPAMTSADNVAFRQNITNRIWAMLMGQGFVEPLDMFHEGNAATHPDLLREIADDLMNHGYDVKYLVKEIVLSETYQRVSEFTDSDTADGNRLYLNASIKPLSPEQFAWSLLQAVGLIEKTRASVVAAAVKENAGFDTGSEEGLVLIEEKIHAALQPQVDIIVKVFAASNPASRFDASANHALYLLNGPEVATWLTVGQDLLLDRLLATTEDQQLVEDAFLAIYSRRPEQAEAKLAMEFIQTDGSSREETVRELLRTLLCSAEFRFNK